MHVSTVDPRSFLTSHGISEHRDELSRYLTMGVELTPAARTVARSRKFRRCAKEWCLAASNEFKRTLFAGGAR